MKTFRKEYIGKGKKTENLEIVKVTLKVEDLQKHIYEKEGEQYLTFEVAQLKSPDKFGRTHTCYVSVLEEEKKKYRKPKSK